MKRRTDWIAILGLHLHPERADKVEDERDVDDHRKQVVGRRAVWRTPELEARKGKGDEQAAEQLEELARRDERQKARQQQRARRLDQRPPERRRAQRAVQKVEGARERCLGLAADGVAAGAQQAGIEERHADAKERDRQRTKRQEARWRAAAVAAHRVVGGQEANVGSAVDLLKALARAERLKALGRDRRVEEKGAPQHEWQRGHHRAAAGLCDADAEQDDAERQQRGDEQLRLQRARAKAAQVQPRDPAKELQLQRGKEAARERQVALGVADAIDVANLRDNERKAEE